MAPSTPVRDRADRLAAHRLPVSRARFVDSARAEALHRLGVTTVGDLVRHFPFRYLDLTNVLPLAQVKHGTDSTVVGQVHEIRVKKPKPRLSITEVALFDGTGVVIGVWFNQPWVQQRFQVGERVAFAGRVEIDFGFKRIKNPFVEKLSSHTDGDPEAGRILPVHRTTEGLSTNWLRRLVAAAVDDHADIPDHLPSTLRVERGLVPLRTALRDVHFPARTSQADAARTRLAYDELLQLQLFMAMRRHKLTREHAGIAHMTDGPSVRA